MEGILDWQTYRSKPVIKKALKLTTGTWSHSGGSTYRFFSSSGEGSILFTATAPISEEDYIIMQSTDDVYHVPAKVFQEKYELAQ